MDVSQHIPTKSKYDGRNDASLISEVWSGGGPEQTPKKILSPIWGNILGGYPQFFKPVAIFGQGSSYGGFFDQGGC